MKLSRVLVFLLLTLSCLGFYPFGQRWQITPDDPTLWIKSCSSPEITSSNLPAGDPLGGRASVTYAEVVQAIIDDYNSIPTSFIRLAIYPSDPANPGTPVAGDSTFTTEKAANRTIDVCVATPSSPVAGGDASLEKDGSNIVGCTIRLKSSITGDATQLTRTLTHELGHCVGLGHAQELTHALMSYFSPDDVQRLQPDDKNGVTYLYPLDASDGKETLNMGLACKPKG